MKLNPDSLIFRCVQLAAVSVFAGRAWQHLFYDAPFRTLLWDEHWMRPIVERVGWSSWDSYITSPTVDARIEQIIFGFGVFYVLCALGAALIQYLPTWLSRVLLSVGTLALLFLGFLYCKEKFFSLGQLLEYSLQISAPGLLFLFFLKKRISSQWLWWLKLAIAFTFICHGLYAVGYYPRPGYFTEMTMNILGCSEQTAIVFLRIAAALDFVIGIGIFFPVKVARWIVGYAVIWGLATTLARIWAYLEWDFLLETLGRWGFETLYRFPHFLLPLTLYLYWKKLSKNASAYPA